jgi:predicted DNA binding protein
MLKKIFALIFCVFLLGGTLFAQSDKAVKKMQKMTELVKLTPAQQDQYKALLIRSEEEVQELKKSFAKLSKKEKSKAKNSNKDKYEAALKNILTPEQLKFLKKNKKNKKDKKDK